MLRNCGASPLIVGGPNTTSVTEKKVMEHTPHVRDRRRTERDSMLIFVIVAIIVIVIAGFAIFGGHCAAGDRLDRRLRRRFRRQLEPRRLGWLGWW